MAWTERRSGGCAGFVLAVACLAGMPACDGATTHPDQASSGGGAVQFTLPDVDGVEVEVGAEGEVIVVAFWATWCQPCQSELKELNGTYARLRDRGLRVYAVSIDDPNTAAQVGPWAAREGYAFPVLMDQESQILGRYHPRKEIPYTLVLAKDGRVIEDHQSYNPGDVEQLEGRLEELLSSAD